MNKLYEKFQDSLLTLLGVIKYHTLLKKTESFGEVEIKIYQQQKLRELLIYCSKHIPFYQNQFVCIFV